MITLTSKYKVDDKRVYLRQSGKFVHEAESFPRALMWAARMSDAPDYARWIEQHEDIIFHFSKKLK